MDPVLQAALDAALPVIQQTLQVWLAGGLVLGGLVGLAGALLLAALRAFEVPGRWSTVVVALAVLLIVGSTSLFGGVAGVAVGVERVVYLVTTDPAIRAVTVDPIGGVAHEHLVQLVATRPGATPEEVSARVAAWREGGIPLTEVDATLEAAQAMLASPEAERWMNEELPRMLPPGLLSRSDVARLAEELRGGLQGGDPRFARAWAERSDYAARDGDASRLSRAEVTDWVIDLGVMPFVYEPVRAMVILLVLSLLPVLALLWAAPMLVAWLWRWNVARSTG